MDEIGRARGWDDGNSVAVKLDLYPRTSTAACSRRRIRENLANDASVRKLHRPDN